MTHAVHAQVVKAVAAALGFDRVGITAAAPLGQAAYYKSWLSSGHAGSMAYLSRNVSAREDPRELLPGAKSVICVALNYRRPPDAAPPEGPHGRVAQYARGTDYHVVLRGMLRELVGQMRQQIAESFEARECVDTAPLLERELARRAGLGWIGKNTCLLHEKAGSYLFLGEVLTTLVLTPDEPVEDHCGTCTRCLEACPTQAFPAPYQMDASRCISYFTIEHRGEIPADLAARSGDWVFGCDICQDVCPFNGRAPLGKHPQIAADRIPAHVPLPQLVELSSSAYKRLTNGTAATRATRKMWERNARIALNNDERTT